MKKPVKITFIVISSILAFCLLLIGAFYSFVFAVQNYANIVNVSRYPVYNYSGAIDDYKNGTYLEYDVTGEIDNFFPRYSEIEGSAKVARFNFSDYYTNFPEEESEKGHQWGNLVIVFEENEHEYLEIKNKLLSNEVLKTTKKEDFMSYQIKCNLSDFHCEVSFCDKINAIRYFFTYQIELDSPKLQKISQRDWYYPNYTDEDIIEFNDRNSFEETRQRHES